MKGSIFLALLFFISIFAGCIEEGENEVYTNAMESFSSPDTRFITNPRRSLTYDFGNEHIIAQSTPQGIEKLWMAVERAMSWQRAS